MLDRFVSERNVENDALSEDVERATEAFRNQQWTEVVALHDSLRFGLDLSRRWSEAKAVTEMALAAARQLGDEKLQARYTHDLADANARLGYYREAEALYADSFVRFEQHGDYHSATKSLHLLAQTRRTLGKYVEAEAMARECLKRAARFDMGAWRAHPLHTLAYLARDRTDYARALEYLTEALRIHEDGDEHDRDFMLAQSHYDMARTLITMGDPSDRIAAHVNSVIELAKRGGNVRDLGYMALRLYGDYAFSEGELFQALIYYQRALDQAQATLDQRRVAEIWIELARTHWRSGHFRKALGYLLNVVGQLRGIGLLSPLRIWTVLHQRLKRMGW